MCISALELHDYHMNNLYYIKAQSVCFPFGTKMVGLGITIPMIHAPSLDLNLSNL